jgi:hypothetical protein
LSGKDTTAEIIASADELRLTVDELLGVTKAAARLVELDCMLSQLSVDPDAGARGAWFARADQRRRLIASHARLFADTPTDPPTAIADETIKTRMDDLLTRWRRVERGPQTTTVAAERAFAELAWRCVDGGDVTDEELATPVCDVDTLCQLIAEQSALATLADAPELSTALAARMRLQQLDAASESKRSAVATIRRNRNAQAACT